MQRSWGVTTIFLIAFVVVGQAVYWLIASPARASAGGTRVALVWAQLIAGLVFFIIATRKYRRVPTG